MMRRIWYALLPALVLAIPAVAWAADKVAMACCGCPNCPSCGM